MANCECGCGGVTTGGPFLSGHDQKLLGVLANEAGGVLRVRDIVRSVLDYDALSRNRIARLTDAEFAKLAEWMDEVFENLIPPHVKKIIADERTRRG